jgi:hypothetical protein
MLSEDPFKFQLLYVIFYMHDWVYVVEVRDQWLGPANSI